MSASIATRATAVRCGAPVGVAWKLLRRAARRRFATWCGPAALGCGDVIDANAVGVPGAMGRLDTVRRMLGDRRELAARAAADTLRLADEAAAQSLVEVVAVPT